MKCKKAASAKVLFGFFNTVFFACGFLEVLSGFFLLCDSKRMLLSRLLADPDADLMHPPFYYLALALLAAGVVVCATAALGCWASYMPGYVILTVYFMVVLSLLAGTCAGGAAAAAWRRCGGLATSRGGPVVALQSHYAVPDYEPFSAAMDLAQTELQCCGMSDARDYELSQWQARRLGPRGLVVPPACCVQTEPASHLNPHPYNATRCQLNQPDPRFRHVSGCLDKLEDWYQEQFLIFMLALFMIALFKLSILLSTIYSCISYRKKRLAEHMFMMKSIDNKTNENIYESKLCTIRDEPITAKYVQPNNFYSPRVRNPRIFHNKPNDVI